MPFPGLLNLQDKRRLSSKNHELAPLQRDTETIQRCIYLDIRCYEQGDFSFITLVRYVLHDLLELRSYIKWEKKFKRKEQKYERN